MLRSFPALKRACKLLDKAARAGVSAPDAAEIARLIADFVQSPGEEAEKDVGDLLLLVCALANRRGTDAEIALNAAADRFIERFDALESACAETGEPLPAGEDYVEKYWNRVIL